MNKLEKLVGTKQKIYYPWKQRYIHRVVRKDWNGFYVKYEGQRRKLRLAINDFGDFLGFEMLHGGIE